MLVDGRTIAAEIVATLASQTADPACGLQPRLAIVTCAPNFETRKYLALKERRALAAGITLELIELPETATTDEVVGAVQNSLTLANAVVVQLPLPAHIDSEVVLAAIPVGYDPDGFSYDGNNNACVPPVVAAVVAIARTYNISFLNKNVVIMGQGRLVGAPMKRYLESLGVTPVVLTEASHNAAETLRAADIVVTGVGKPGLVTPEHVKEGVVIFDAGTSEEGGMLVGDVKAEVANKAALFTPVPGGIGPVTVAVLLANVMELAKQQWQGTA